MGKPRMARKLKKKKEKEKKAQYNFEVEGKKMEIENICKICAYFRTRKGTPYCSVIKQKVKEDYSCKKFEPK